jgi:peptide/nickel transport system permease protein
MRSLTHGSAINPAEADGGVALRGGSRRLFSRAISRWGVSGTTGALILTVLVLVAAGGPEFTGDPVRMSVPERLQSPSMRHLMGTDQFGRDILSRVVHGARISLATGVGVVVVGLGLGITIGMASAYRGGSVALILMGLVDLMLALPGVLLAIVIAALLSPRLTTAVLAVGIVTVPYYARLIWGVTQTIRVQSYVEAAVAGGASDLRIMARYILPAILPPSLVQATLGIGNGILTVTGLSFLGVGAQPPTPEWGLMLSEAQRFVLNAPYMGIFPGAGIMAAVLSFNLIGDALRDRLDPVVAHVVRK